MEERSPSASRLHAEVFHGLFSLANRNVPPKSLSSGLLVMK